MKSCISVKLQDQMVFMQKLLKNVPIHINLLEMTILQQWKEANVRAPKKQIYVLQL